MKRVLTGEQAMAMRDTYQQRGAGMTTLAAQYQVSVATVSRVITGLHSAVKDQPNIARPALLSAPGKYSVRLKEGRS